MQIAIIGSGNMATHCGKAFLKAGHTIVSVFSRDFKHAQQLAIKLNAVAVEKIGELKADFILIAVNDDAIKMVAAQIENSNSLVVHTSGSVDAKVLKHLKNYGVFYPLQSIQKNRKLNFRKIPICIEASNTSAEKKLMQLANSVSETVFVLNSQQRLTAHLSAVIANNFSNHLLVLAEKLLAESHLPFELIQPLILATAKNVQSNSPSKLQTGPAKRGDKKTIELHLKLLKKDKELQAIYKLMSDSVFKNYKS